MDKSPLKDINSLISKIFGHEFSLESIITATPSELDYFVKQMESNKLESNKLGKLIGKLFEQIKHDIYYIDPKNNYVYFHGNFKKIKYLIYYLLLYFLFL